VPSEDVLVGGSIRLARPPKLLTFEGVVGVTVGELGAQTGANQESSARLDRDVAQVKEPMKVSAKRQTVGQYVSSASCIGTDVDRLESRHRVLACDGAPAAVGVEDREPE